jgi:hypothetical protein
MMDPTERATLFRLALPELRAASLTATSTAILDAFGSYRGLMRRLWAATTEAEALTITREHAMTQLAPTRMQTCTRIGEGCREYASTGDGVDADSTRRTDARFRAHLGDAAIDDILFYTLMAQPGEVMTRSQRTAVSPTFLRTIAERSVASSCPTGRRPWRSSDRNAGLSRDSSQFITCPTSFPRSSSHS